MHFGSRATILSSAMMPVGLARAASALGVGASQAVLVVAVLLSVRAHPRRGNSLEKVLEAVVLTVPRDDVVPYEVDSMVSVAVTVLHAVGDGGGGAILPSDPMLGAHEVSASYQEEERCQTYVTTGQGGKQAPS